MDISPNVNRVPKCLKTSVTRWLNYLFNISKSTTTQICPICSIKCVSTFCKVLNKPLRNGQTLFKCFSKYFAKSGLAAQNIKPCSNSHFLTNFRFIVLSPEVIWCRDHLQASVSQVRHYVKSWMYLIAAALNHIAPNALIWMEMIR